MKRLDLKIPEGKRSEYEAKSDTIVRDFLSLDFKDIDKWIDSIKDNRSLFKICFRVLWYLAKK